MYGVNHLYHLLVGGRTVFHVSELTSHHAMYHHAHHPLYASPQEMAQHGPQLKTLPSGFTTTEWNNIVITSTCFYQKDLAVKTSKTYEHNITL